MPLLSSAVIVQEVCLWVPIELIAITATGNCV